MLERTIPPILYKYRNFDARSISMLANNQLYFASPLLFNDPFDCLGQEHVFENVSPESLEKLALASGVSVSDLTPEKAATFEAMVRADPEILKLIDAHKQLQKKHMEVFGILSLTECNDSILMWSHYAHYHSGFCIGFKNGFGLDETLIKKISYTDKRDNDLADQYFKTEGMDEEQKQNFYWNLLFFNKYIDWAYEREWRITGEIGLALYKDIYMDSIIFGLKMSAENRNTIRTLLANKNIRYFEAVKNTRAFALDIVPC